MACRVLKAGDFKNADVMFDDLALAMEDTFGVDHASTIGLLVSIGITYQVNGRWVDARPRFTRALSALLGVESLSFSTDGLIKDLEKALEDEAFPLGKERDKDTGGWAITAFEDDSSVFNRRQGIYFRQINPSYDILG
jgi:hypothetical protein